MVLCWSCSSDWKTGHTFSENLTQSNNNPHFRHDCVGQKRQAESASQDAKSQHPIPMLHLKVEGLYLADARITHTLVPSLGYCQVEKP